MSNQMAIRYMWWKDGANQWMEERTVELCDNFCLFEILDILRAYSPRPEIATASVRIYATGAHDVTLFDGVVRFH